jgi:hypothetical protein
MRKVILLIITVAMIAGGLYLLAAELLWARIIYFKVVIGAAVLLTLGAYLLWNDFVGPLFGKGGK